jgi:hypothetical protein
MFIDLIFESNHQMLHFDKQILPKKTSDGCISMQTSEYFLDWQFLRISKMVVKVPFSIGETQSLVVSSHKVTDSHSNRQWILGSQDDLLRNFFLVEKSSILQNNARFM